MSQAPTYVTWKVICRSPEAAQALREWLSGRIDLDRRLTDTIRTAPNGVEQIQTVSHQLRDYFADIRILPDSQPEAASFRLSFHRQPGAERFWKDLMVNILQEIDSGPQQASTQFDSKGDAGG